MRAIVTDGVALWSVGLSVCLSEKIVSPVEIAERIEMLFGLRTWVGPRKHVLDKGAHWRHLANTIEPSIAAAMQPFCQIPEDYDDLQCAVLYVVGRS